MRTTAPIPPIRLRFAQSKFFEFVKFTMARAQSAQAGLALARRGTRSTAFRAGGALPYSASVSIRSASPKSSSVRPPLLWVERTRRTLL